MACFGRFFDFLHCNIVVKNCHINDNGGFTVIGWYKKGSINDISTEESDNQVESSEMGYHIVSITPTNKTILENEEYKKLRFNIGDSIA